MDMKFEQKVRERAYEIWMSAGMSDGMAHEHWVIAEQAVANETGEPVSAKTSATKKAASPAKTTSTKKASAKVSATKSVPTKSIATKPSAKAAKGKH